MIYTAAALGGIAVLGAGALSGEIFLSRGTRSGGRRRGALTRIVPQDTNPTPQRADNVRVRYSPTALPVQLIASAAKGA